MKSVIENLNLNFHWEAAFSKNFHFSLGGILFYLFIWRPLRKFIHKMVIRKITKNAKEEKIN